MIIIGRIHFRMGIYHVGFSSPMLGFEDGKAMEEMHVVMREESRVESCALLGLWFGLPGCRATRILVKSASVVEACQWCGVRYGISSLGLGKCGNSNISNAVSKQYIRLFRSTWTTEAFKSALTVSSPH
jgi:hypothetical protein